jgi:hypothetical protein
MAQALLLIKESLESPINWRGTSFSIPADFEVGFSLDKKALRKVPKDEFSSVERLARFLSGIRG